jgi:hypothetical protein
MVKLILLDAARLKPELLLPPMREGCAFGGRKTSEAVRARATRGKTGQDRCIFATLLCEAWQE